MNFYIFNDASSHTKGKKREAIVAGYHCKILDMDTYEELYSNTRFFNKSTAQFNELFGVVDALEYLVNNYDNITKITVISDSTYVIDGADKLLTRWIRNGWKVSSGEPVKNKALWEVLHELKTICTRNRTNLSFIWQRGHTDTGKSITFEENPIIYFQELCDTIVTDTMKQVKEKIYNT